MKPTPSGKGKIRAQVRYALALVEILGWCKVRITPCVYTTFKCEGSKKMVSTRGYGYQVSGITRRWGSQRYPVIFTSLPQAIIAAVQKTVPYEGVDLTK